MDFFTQTNRYSQGYWEFLQINNKYIQIYDIPFSPFPVSILMFLYSTVSPVFCRISCILPYLLYSPFIVPYCNPHILSSYSILHILHPIVYRSYSLYYYISCIFYPSVSPVSCIFCIICDKVPYSIKVTDSTVFSTQLQSSVSSVYIICLDVTRFRIL